MESEYKAKIIRGKGTPITPGTIQRYVPADFPEFSSDEEELPAPPQQSGNFRPHACDNEEPTSSQAASSQPSWTDLHPKFAANSSGGPVKDIDVVKAYKEDLAVIERPSKRKAEEITADLLMVLKRKSFLLLLKS